MFTNTRSKVTNIAGQKTAGCGARIATSVKTIDATSDQPDTMKSAPGCRRATDVEMRPPSKRAGEAGDHEEQAEGRRRAPERDAALAHEVGRHPRRQAAHAERVDDLGRGVDDVAPAARQRAQRGGQAERRGGDRGVLS